LYDRTKGNRRWAVARQGHLFCPSAQILDRTGYARDSNQGGGKECGKGNRCAVIEYLLVNAAFDNCSQAAFLCQIALAATIYGCQDEIC
jgi:hypothetical protein